MATYETVAGLSHPRLAAARRTAAARSGTIGYPDAHAVAVARCAADIAGELRLAAPEQEAVVDGALLHDIGKTKIAPAILNKPGPLNRREQAEVRRHPQIGVEMLDGAVDGRVLAVVRGHHERWDGGGYPDGLAGEQIPLPARVVAVADAFFAMLEERPYRPSKTVDSALAELKACAGSQFDASCVEALAATVTNH